MRIGIYDPYLDTLSGGEKYMLSIASCLAKEHKVFIFWDKNKEAEIKQAAFKKLGIDLSSAKFYRNIFSRDVSLASRFIESRKFDKIIYLSNGSIPFVGAKLFIHFQFPIEGINGSSIKNRIKLFFVKKIFCNSNFTKYYIDKKLGIASNVLYPPVKINALKSIKKENIILHVGRFSVDKNGSNYKKQDVMINVFKKIVDKGLKNWQFIMMIGTRGKDHSNVSKLKEMGNGYSIKIIENPLNEILWEYYSKAKIYWHATGYGEDLRKYPEKAEHFGISTVEAMGSGAVPVVVNAGGQKEIVENEKNGYLWDNLEDFMKKTNDLINDVKLLEEMSKEAKIRSEFFAGDRFCKEVKGIIK